MKKSIIFFMVFVLVVSAAPLSFAASVTTGSEYAALLNQDFYVHNDATITGNIYTANGNVILEDMGKKSVLTGSVYYNKANDYTNNSQMKITGSVTPLDSTEYNAKSISGIDAPSIANYTESYTAGWWPEPIDVTQSTHFGTLNISNYLTVDTSGGDITLVVDNLIMSGTGKINITGGGTLYLFVDNGLSVSNSCAINPDGDNDKAQIFLTQNSLNLSGSGKIYGNIYMLNDTSDITVNGSGKLYGNIVTSADNISITGGCQINGTVYAPQAAAVLASSGTINGRIVANSLEMYGTGKLIYNASYIDLNLPGILEKAALNVTVSPAGAGTVTPSDGEYSYGQVVELNVTPNTGYAFDKFESDSVLPDADGKITMTGSVNLTAVFKSVETPPISGDPVNLEYSYAYLYGYDDASGRVGPEDPITREQASALIFRILKQNEVTSFSGPATPTFKDINSNRWSYLALEYMTSIDVFNSASGTISPEQEITRGEAAKIISKALNIAPDSSAPNSLDLFSDIDKANPYYYYIKALYDSGNLQGAGTKMMPDSTLTRAQVVTIINRLIGRDGSYDISSVTESPYSDISASDWYYADIVRASFGFSEEPDPSDNLYKIDPEKKRPREEIDY